MAAMRSRYAPDDAAAAAVVEDLVTMGIPSRDDRDDRDEYSDNSSFMDGPPGC
jgi:hypothetical protein